MRILKLVEFSLELAMFAIQSVIAFSRPSLLFLEEPQLECFKAGRLMLFLV